MHVGDICAHLHEAGVLGTVLFIEVPFIRGLHVFLC